MTINIYCDNCDWFGEVKDFNQHLDDNEACDYREQCCKSKSIKDYDELEADEICENCLRQLEDYWEDFWTDIAMGER